MRLSIVVIASVVVIVISPMPTAQALTNFGISISDTCYQMHKFNITSLCPTYEAILGVFPDTSNPQVSGKFLYHDGQLQRDSKHLNNHYEFYKYSKQSILFVDPPGDIRDRIKMIRITSHDFVYPINEQTLTGPSYVVGQSRYVNPNCSEALINAENWLFLLGDTMLYMQKDCKRDFTDFNEIKYRKWNATQHDISTSQKWLHEQWLKSVKDNCIYKYDVC